MAKKKTIVKPLMGVFNTGQWKSIGDTTVIKDGVYVLNYDQLREYQKEILQSKEDTTLPHFFINCPTGAGKSKACLALLSKFEKNTKNLIIITAPQKEIGKNFLSSTGLPQKILDHKWLINPSNQLCEGSYKNEDGNIERLRSLLASPRLSDLNDRIVICCHATLALLFDRLSSEEKKRIFNNVRLCVDESHHSLSQEETGNGLGKVVNYFLKHHDRNLELTMMTATPFRGDKGSLIPEKYNNQFCRYDLDYGRHFEENCNGLEFTYNAVLHQYGDCYGKVIEELMDKHLDDGDKVLIQIPPSNKSISNGKFNDLQMMYDSIGKTQKVDDNGVVLIKRGSSWVKIIDLITEKDRSKRLDYLRNNQKDIDVVIGIALIKEGFDWTPANAGILIGSQGSLNAQIQIMGRMFRDYDNKGKNRGKKPVTITQIFPYVDHTNLDEDQTREQINTFMKVVYAALAMELVINPIHIELPTKVDDKGESMQRQSVKGFLCDSLTDTQYTDLMASVMDDYRDWKANAGEDEKVSDKISEIVSQKLTELGIDENHREVSEFFNKSLQRAAKFQLMAMDGIDVSHIDINLMEDISDPIESILMGMSNGLCGANDIKSFQALMKPVDTLRRCYELKEWVEKKSKFPRHNSFNVDESSLAQFASIMRMNYRRNPLKMSQSHISILESIAGWFWDGCDIAEVKCNNLKSWVVANGRFPSKGTEDPIEKELSNFVFSMRSAKKGRGRKINDNHIKILESIDGWKWVSDDNHLLNRCEELKDWIVVEGRFPSHSSSNILEKSLYSLITSLKQSKRGKGNYNISDQHIKILESIDGWRWMEDNTLIRCNDLVDYYIANNKLPSKYGSATERSLYNFIRSMKKAKGGIGTCKITPEHIVILESIPQWKW